MGKISQIGDYLGFFWANDRIYMSQWGRGTYAQKYSVKIAPCFLFVKSCAKLHNNNSLVYTFDVHRI